MAETERTPLPMSLGKIMAPPHENRAGDSVCDTAERTGGSCTFSASNPPYDDC